MSARARAMMRLGMAAAVLGATLACGARSQLDSPGVAGGGAGATGSDGGAGGGGRGGGGPGGSAPGCSDLDEPWPSRRVAGDGFDQLTPQLLALDGPRIVVTLGWRVTGAPAPTELRHLSFTAWPDWPGLEGVPVYLADFDRGVRFRPAAAPSGRFALLMSDGALPTPPEGIAFANGYVPGSGEMPAVEPIEPFATEPLFASLSGEAHLLGFRDAPSSNQQSLAHVHVAGGLGLPTPVPLGCASGEVPADAVARQDGWLVAAASAGPLPDPCIVAGPAGAAERIGIASVTPAGAVSEIDAVRLDHPAHRIELDLATSGAWLTFDHEAPGWVPSAARLRADGSVEVPPFPIAPFAESSFGAAALGDSLLVAWLDSTPSLEIRLVQPDGTVAAARSIALDGPSVTHGPPSVVASPEGDSAVIAWSQGTSPARVRLLRIDCL